MYYLCFSRQAACRLPTDNAGSQHQGSRDWSQRCVAVLCCRYSLAPYFMGAGHAAGGSQQKLTIQCSRHRYRHARYVRHSDCN